MSRVFCFATKTDFSSSFCWDRWLQPPPPVQTNEKKSKTTVFKVWSHLCRKNWPFIFFCCRIRLELWVRCIKIMVIDINVENTIRWKLKMRLYNSVQMSSLRIRCYVFSVISVYKENDVWASDLRMPELTLANRNTGEQTFNLDSPPRQK